MSGDEPDGEDPCVVILCGSGTASTLVDTARLAAEAAMRTGGIVITTMDELGTAPKVGYADLVFRIRKEMEQAHVPLPVLQKKTAYERANPNQPFYAKLRKEDKKKNRHGRRKK